MKMIPLIAKLIKLLITLFPMCLLLVLSLSVTNGQEANQQSTAAINGLDGETTAFLDWFFVNELLPYFLITSNQFKPPPLTINPQGLIFSPSTPTITTANWFSPLQPLMIRSKQLNHYHQHVNLPGEQLIANIMPHLVSTIKDNNIPMESNEINQPNNQFVYPKTLINTNPDYQLSPTTLPLTSAIYFNHQIDQSSNHFPSQQQHRPPRVSSRRHFGSPVPGRMTNDNFDKEKTIDESRAEKINPLIKVNVKIRENIKALKELEATFQRQPIPRRIVSKLLLRAILNPL